MKRITWKKDTIISIALKDNTYCLAQMLQEPYLCLFNLFSKDNKWDDITINQSDILFIKPVVRAFLKSGSVEKKTNIKPLENIEVPTRWIKTFAGSMKIDLWENTEDEISFIHLAQKKGAMLVENSFDTQNRPIENTIINSINLEDNQTIKNHEINSLSIYPELNERLYLCYIHKQNIDPMKMIAFNKEVPLFCKEYIKAISGKYTIEELGY